MSRIGKKPIKIPNGVKAKFENSQIIVEGPKGKLIQKVHHAISVDVKQDEIIVIKKEELEGISAIHGLTRALIANMMKGVTLGYSKALDVVGVGYRMELKGKDVVFALGYSHPVVIKAPEGVTFKLESPTAIVVEGADKQKVGQLAAEIREIRLPEPYRGKGVKYRNEVILRKAGKTGM